MHAFVNACTWASTCIGVGGAGTSHDGPTSRRAPATLHRWHRPHANHPPCARATVQHALAGHGAHALASDPLMTIANHGACARHPVCMRRPGDMMRAGGLVQSLLSARPDNGRRVLIVTLAGSDLQHVEAGATAITLIPYGLDAPPSLRAAYVQHVVLGVGSTAASTPEGQCRAANANAANLCTLAGMGVAGAEDPAINAAGRAKSGAAAVTTTPAAAETGAVCGASFAQDTACPRLNAAGCACDSSACGDLAPTKRVRCTASVHFGHDHGAQHGSNGCE